MFITLFLQIIVKKPKKQLMLFGVERQKEGAWSKSNSSSCREPILSFLSVQGQPTVSGQYLKKSAFSPKLKLNFGTKYQTPEIPYARSSHLPRSQIKRHGIYRERRSVLQPRTCHGKKQSRHLARLAILEYSHGYRSK
jgi:hypothetical protein